jgi:hypothetical protein
MSSDSSSTKNHRRCSALGRAVTRMECASRRVSGIPCSSDCVHNPFGFANYQRFRELERRWFDKAIRRTSGAGPKTGESYDDLPDLRVLREMAEVQRVMTVLLGDSGIEVGSPLEQWAADPESALTNDERLMSRFRLKTRATVIEIQRSMGEDRCVARDMFDPGGGEFLIFHPTLAKAPRFSRHLGWYTWFPHFVHPLSSMVELVPHLWFAWREAVTHEVRHRQSQDYTMNCQRFLREKFLASIRVLGCLIQDWESTSEPVEPSSHSAAVYRVRDAIPKLKALFEANPACAPFLVLPRHPSYGDCRGEYRFRVRAAPEDLEACPPYLGADRDSPGERTIGMISLYDQVLLFHCYSRPALKVGRRFLEEEFEGRLEFDYEDTLELTDLAKWLEPAFAVRPLPLAKVWKDDPRSAWHPGAGEPASPEFLKRCRQEMVRWLEEHHAGTFAGFLDKPHFFLDDRTPREASRSEQDRPQLVELMKVALYEIDQRNRRFELALSIDAILRELGLTELLGG